jgi:hypothetical protein
MAFSAFMAVLPASVALAQEAGPSVIVLPGSVNANFGSVGPLEPGNVVSSATFEQGVTMWRRGPLFAVAFVDVTVKADTQGYGWNNTMPYLGGAKMVLAGDHGVVQAVVGLAGDARRETPEGVRPAAYVSYWAGWRQPAGNLSYPGSTWATTGVTTAAEPDNWITAAHVDQGVAVKRIGGAALVPFAAATAAFDTRNYVWNNRGSIDAGVKVATQLRGVALDLGIAQRLTHEWKSGKNDAGPVVFFNVWLGWMPRITR